jgi:nicotinamide mononucleotide transporter
MDAVIEFLRTSIADPLEVPAMISYALSVWFLARNSPLGWWLGLAGTLLYCVVFYRGALYGEILINGFYFFTTLWAIHIWLHGSAERAEKPVGALTGRGFALCVLAAVAGTLALWPVLVWLRGQVPFWDAFTTSFSFAAQILLMLRIRESWYLWITVDVVYVPLYWSRDYHLTSVLYAAFLVLAVMGLLTFRRIVREQATVRPQRPGPMAL